MSKGWLARRFDENEDFEDANSVMLAFRTVKSMEGEHWMNLWAARLTRRYGDVAPGGQMAHAELLFALDRNEYVKASVIKKSYGGKKPDGSIIWKPGGVHFAKTSKSEWATKYVFVKFHARRSSIKKMVDFLSENDSMPFNFSGYVANLWLPGGWGLRRWREGIVPRKYFCTELLVAALQCLSHYEGSHREYLHWTNQIWRINAATSNPNLLYRKLKQSGAVFDTVPLLSDLRI